MNKDGKLTPEETKKAIAWINNKAPKLACPSCGAKNFTIAEHYLAPPLWYGGSMMVGGTSYPMFILTCTNCFYVMPYSAIASGVLVPDMPAADASVPPSTNKEGVE